MSHQGPIIKTQEIINFCRETMKIKDFKSHIKEVEKYKILLERPEISSIENIENQNLLPI